MKIFRNKIFFVFVATFLSSIYLINAGFCAEQPGCSAQSPPVTILGDSIEPIFHNGQKITYVQFSPACHTLTYGDIILYKNPYKKNPFIKIIKGLPGDKLSIQESQEPGRWNIFINGSIQKNSEGIPYAVGYRAWARTKRLPPVIPEKSYFILGNQAHGSLDSTQFGFVREGDILGLVEK